MKKNLLKYLAVFITVSIVTIVSCSKNNESDKGTSTFNLRLTDAPTAFDEVNVDIQEVRVKFGNDTTGNSGWVSMNTFKGVYNLLGLQNGVDTLLATSPLPKDTIKEIRFILGTNNTIKDNGTIYPLVIPSGSQSGLKIKISKKLSATLETVIIDFDAALSVKKEGNGDYKLRPVLKIK